MNNFITKIEGDKNMTTDNTPETPDECPHCGSSHVDHNGDFEQFGRNGGQIPVKCWNCHSEWLEIWTFKTIEITEINNMHRVDENE
tara:strand:- start:260 stop:517 length:258 start_codon:yes stop_codon:yes gene_type:complete